MQSTVVVGGEIGDVDAWCGPWRGLALRGRCVRDQGVSFVLTRRRPTEPVEASLVTVALPGSRLLSGGIARRFGAGTGPLGPLLRGQVLKFDERFGVAGVQSGRDVVLQPGPVRAALPACRRPGRLDGRLGIVGGHLRPVLPRSAVLTPGVGVVQEGVDPAVPLRG